MSNDEKINVEELFERIYSGFCNIFYDDETKISGIVEVINGKYFMLDKNDRSIIEEIKTALIKKVVVPNVVKYIKAENGLFDTIENH